jgi:hypothetical protein
LLILAAALLIAMLVFTPATDAADGITIKSDAGVILLNTGPDSGDNWIRYYDEDDLVSFNVDSFTDEQEISLSKCKINTDNSILEISSTGGNQFGLGLVSNGIGVRTKNNCATGNGQVDVSQSLTFTLNLTNPSFDSTYAIEHAEVDVEGKQDAGLAYRLDGGAEQTATLNSSSDNGPDSGTGDNTPVSITPAESFLSITFSPTGNDKALIAIEGGGDGPLPGGGERAALEVNQTLFRLVTSETFDGNLLCDGPRVPTSIAADGPAVAGSVERLDDLKGTGDCEIDAVPYTFQIESESVYFDYLDSGEGAQFIVRIDWKPGDPVVDPIAPPVRQIDYTDDGVENYVDGVACVSVSGGVYVHPTDGGGNVIPWCLIDHDIELTPDGWQQVQWWHGQGDPRWK